MKPILITLLILILSGCEKTETTVDPVDYYEQNGVVIHTTKEGIVIERTSFWTGKKVADTLVMNYTEDQIDALLYWPSPYSITFQKR